MQLVWSPLAIEQVVKISKYIAKDKPDVATSWAKSIFQTVEKLEQFPKIGRIVPELLNDNFREIICGNYRIIYRVKNNFVDILAVKNVRQILHANEIKNL
jgi:toxin ParE1/3/4